VALDRGRVRVIGRRKGRGTRIRFAVENGRRVVTVEGAGLAEAERRRLRALLRPLPIRSGVVTVRTDGTGARRVSFTRDIAEPMQQVIRNIVGNLARLR
jgi:hypothetical protein